MYLCYGGESNKNEYKRPRFPPGSSIVDLIFRESPATCPNQAPNNFPGTSPFAG